MMCADLREDNMTDSQMASDIKWHILDDQDTSTYPKKIGELYLVRISGPDRSHHYAVARLWLSEEYKKTYPQYNISSKEKYMFSVDGSDLPFRRKSAGKNYVDGWNDLLFTSQSIPRSKSPSNSKVWLDLRNKQKETITKYEEKMKEELKNG